MRTGVFVLVCVVVGLLAVKALAAEPFDAKNSVWNKALGPEPRAQASDDSVRQAFINATHTRTVWIQTDSYSTPIYRPGPNVSYKPVVLDSFRKDTTQQDLLRDVGVPYYKTAQPAAGSDGHITIYQKDTHRLWTCWASSNQGGVLHAQVCQATADTTTDPGYATDHSWDPYTSTGQTFWQGHNWTSTGTGLPVVAGTMTLPQLRAHNIGHALALDLPNVCNSYYAFPAQQHDGGGATGQCVPEGAHIYFPQSVNCSLSLPIQSDICTALKRYGAIVRDSAPGVGLFAEDVAAKGQPDPYYSNERLFGGQYPNNFLNPNVFPWDQARVLPFKTCTNPGVPCLP